ncbi:CatB-related O-acetyltransferase [Rhodococcus sp. ABRD24]|uniref:CatB-related O-acetyltransferase n=1 Tax=Rhodococcus sp. ABRD24 TaxID=2507582 RepID=UPI00103A2014|nr:CatB-related O-acetyltransferase [Rhodococcus sp. ABRD24]QBJ97854.1 CatB-related O-acetyltransferase [Rhodococcus sp. ABRD24]
MGLANWWSNVQSARRRDIDHAQKLGIATVGIATYGDPKILRFRYDKTRLVIGSYCSIAEETLIVLGGEHPIDEITTYPLRDRFGLPGAGEDRHPLCKGDIVIGSDVWIGARATILSGVTIGDGAIVGAGAVIAKDVPPYSIAVGNPARVVRKRYDDETIEALLEIRWWDWPEDKVVDNVELLSSREPSEFLARHRPTERLSS